MALAFEGLFVEKWSHPFFLIIQIVSENINLCMYNEFCKSSNSDLVVLLISINFTLIVPRQ